MTRTNKLTSIISLVYGNYRNKKY